MSQWHPDRHTNKSDSIHDEDYIHEQASQVTHAFATLKEPHTRASHLLQIQGYPVEEETSGSNLVGAEFLMEVMEIRQEIEESDTPKTLQRLWDENEVRIAQACDELSRILDTDSHSDRDFPEAQRLTAMLQYWVRVQETLREKME